MRRKERADCVPVHLFLEKSLLAQVDEYRFEARLASRVVTVQELLRAGLEVLSKKPK
jgi:hypothetical protein